MVGNVYWNVGPSQTAPFGAASSPKGRAKGASLHTMSNPVPINGTLRERTWREDDILPYNGWVVICIAKFQVFALTPC